jgi:hypothetical protein
MGVVYGNELKMDLRKPHVMCSKCRHHSRFNNQFNWSAYVITQREREKGTFTLTSYNFYFQTPMIVKLEIAIGVIHCR